MTDAQIQERAVLNLLRENYAQSGETFIMYPAQELVPSFLGSYRPDAIVKGADEGGVVIEVRSSRASSKTSDKLRDIAERFIGHPEWTFRVVNTDDFADDNYAGTGSPATVPLIIEEFRRSRNAGLLNAALLIGWSAFENVAREHLTSVASEITRPIPAISFVSALEQYGFLEADDAAMMRRIAKLRNDVAHGRFEHVAPTDLAVLERVMMQLLLQQHVAGSGR